MILERQVRRKEPDGRDVDRSVGQHLEDHRKPSCRASSRDPVVGGMFSHVKRLDAELEHRAEGFGRVEFAGVDLSQMSDERGGSLAFGRERTGDRGEKVAIGKVGKSGSR